MKKILIFMVILLLPNAFALYGGGDISSGSSGGSSGGGGGGGGSSPTPTVGEVCFEDWICAKWKECSNGVQTRECFDANNCGSIDFRPKLIQDCEKEVIEQVVEEDEEPSIPIEELAQELADLTPEAINEEIEEINNWFLTAGGIILVVSFGVFLVRRSMK